MRILYVEDNLISLALMERVTRTENHEIISCTRAEDALRALAQEVIDLIIVDIKLDGEMNGLQLTHLLRERGDTRPIIVTTAYEAIYSRKEAQEAGCNEFLTKPLSVRQILTVLATYSTSV